MRANTLVFPIDRPLGRVLLGCKKRGFGAGKYLGFGGGIGAGETVADAAARELLEGSGLTIKTQNLWYVAHLTFVFPAKPEWDSMVHVFRLEFWDGEPQETEEMIPEWFGFDELPFPMMWEDARYWLPPILEGEKLRASFTFDDNNEDLLVVEREGWED